MSVPSTIRLVHRLIFESEPLTVYEFIPRDERGFGRSFGARYL
jgi:hypothetical protein